MLYMEPTLLLSLFLPTFILCHLKLVHFRSENGGVEPAGRDIVSGAGNRFPGRARTARWAFLPRTPRQTSSLCGSLVSCFISLPYLSVTVGISTVTQHRIIHQLLSSYLRFRLIINRTAPCFSCPGPEGHLLKMITSLSALVCHIYYIHIHLAVMCSHG